MGSLYYKGEENILLENYVVKMTFDKLQVYLSINCSLR